MSILRFNKVKAKRLAVRDGPEGVDGRAMEIGRNRVLATAVVFFFLYAAIAGRLVDLTVLGPSGGGPDTAGAGAAYQEAAARADIVDRNGVILATSLPTVSLYADPQEVLDPKSAARRLAKALPALDRAKVEKKLSGNGRFVWIKRNLTPTEQYEVNSLGVPGLAFKRGEHRVYPMGPAAAHVLGYTDVDGNGIAGVERYFDDVLESGGDPLRLSLDIRVQSIVREELRQSVSRFKAIGGAGVVLNVNTGELIASVSLPDFDPNQPESRTGDSSFNRATKGVYEMGSTFKLFTAAMALDSGAVSLRGGYDASAPIRVARFTIADYHAQNRWLSVPEILIHSSNIGAAKMAMDVGSREQKRYLGKLGLLSPVDVELPEVGRPLIPSRWRDVNTMTISYGHGIAVSPVQLAGGIATLINGGLRHPVTLLRQADDDRPQGERVLDAKTSKMMRGLMRLVVTEGTGTKAEAAGYRVGGKTGTAEKQEGGRYRAKSLISSFVGAFPMDDPRYVALVVVDEPVGNKSTLGYATGGWVAAPAVGRVVGRMAPLMGIAPNEAADEASTGEAGRIFSVALKRREKRRASY